MRDRLKLNGFKIGLLITLFVIAIYLIGVPFLDLMELKALDLRFLSRGSVRPGNEVVIAAIDEKSLDELGRWPWSRKKIASLIDILTKYEVKTIGFDIVFAEPDENSVLERTVSFKKKIEELGINNRKLVEYITMAERDADNDEILAKSIKGSDRVILGYFFHTSKKDLGHLKVGENDVDFENISSSKYHSVRYLSEEAKKVTLTEAYAVESNLNKLSTAAKGSGYFNVFPDEDGTVRWYPLVIQHKEQYFPPLSLRVLHNYLGSPLLSLKIADYGIEGIQLGKVKIPTDETGRMLINYAGRQKTFPHYSISDILNDRIPASSLKDKIVLVGATATGIYDMRVTPFSSIYPGVEIHANIIDTILRQHFLVRPEWTFVIDILIILGLGLLLGFLLYKMEAVWGAITTIIFFLGFFILNRYMFVQKGLWINIVYPYLTLLLVYIGVTIYRYFTEEQEKKKIKGAFHYYVTASVVNEMLKNPEKLKLGGEKKELTVLFSDIRGFTTISEKLSPEMLVKLLNEYLTVMTDIVFKYDGLLDKYIGDAIMAVFGAPLDQDDHAARACYTALDMMDELKTLQKKLEADGTPRIDIGIGINSGPMVVGNMGSNSRFDYTVMGDSVNLGSRLEGANKQYHTNIIISELTYEKVKDKFVCRELDSVRVKGKALPVKIYELVGRDRVPDETKNFLNLFHQGLEEYKGRRLKEAIETFSKVLNIKSDDYPSRLYVERSKILIETPPPEDWDGVFTMETK
ncbi:MAG: adenylate/guanylate cyclase domain-containing protein [Pseudomonadota bacterium]